MKLLATFRILSKLHFGYDELGNDSAQEYRQPSYHRQHLPASGGYSLLARVVQFKVSYFVFEFDEPSSFFVGYS